MFNLPSSLKIDDIKGLYCKIYRWSLDRKNGATPLGSLSLTRGSYMLTRGIIIDGKLTAVNGRH